METVADNLNDTSSERAQRQLDTLRAAVEVRLQALEAVLADPNRGESLEGLILDLARVATDEARAAMLKACLDAKLEADARVIHARAVAQEAVDQERLASGELRKALDQTKQRLSNLEQEHIVQMHHLRADLEKEVERERAANLRLEQTATENAQRLEVELASSNELRQLLERERAAAAELRKAAEGERHTLTDLERALEAERTAASELRQAAERAQEAAARAAREQSDAWAAQEALTRDLARERDGVAKLQRLNADLRSQLDAERAAASELKRAAAQTAEDLANAATGRAESAASVEHLHRELAEIRTENGALRVDLDAAGARLEMLDGERLRADRARKDLEARIEALSAERDLFKAEVELARTRIERPALDVAVGGTARVPTVEAMISKPEIAPVSAAPAPAAATPSAEATSPSQPRQPEEEWGPVRLAVRYAFREPLAVQINGDGGLLIDLSVAGCQFVTPTAIRPNQFVKVLLPSESAPLACSGKVMWARFEPKAAGGSIGYRAGVHFTKPDQAALEAFISLSKNPPAQ
ncbi:MAG TPA: PilZ domain-containing protein [Vicinamibacterales bacterium]|nr:PilZ domain-containing protein [Vicinamibacterales bacterium]